MVKGQIFASKVLLDYSKVYSSLSATLQLRFSSNGCRSAIIQQTFGFAAFPKFAILERRRGSIQKFAFDASKLDDATNSSFAAGHRIGLAGTCHSSPRIRRRYEHNFGIHDGTSESPFYRRGAAATSGRFAAKAKLTFTRFFVFDLEVRMLA